MSKRARITLNLDPQEETGATSTVTQGVKAPTGPAVEAESKQKAKVKARPKPKVAPKSQPRKAARVKASTGAAAEAESKQKAGVKPQPWQSINADADSDMAASLSGVEAESVTAAADMPPGKAVPTSDTSPRGGVAGFSLGTFLKVAVVSLVVISAVLWLKRKP